MSTNSYAKTRARTEQCALRQTLIHLHTPTFVAHDAGDANFRDVRRNIAHMFVQGCAHEHTKMYAHNVLRLVSVSVDAQVSGCECREPRYTGISTRTNL